MTTKSFKYEAASNGIVEIMNVIVDHFVNNSFHHEAAFSSTQGVVVQPKVLPEFQASIYRKTSNTIASRVDGGMGFTAAPDVGVPATGGSSRAFNEIESAALSFGSTTVLISEEVDHFTIFTFSDINKKNMNLGIAAGFGYLPQSANDPEFGNTGLWNLNDAPRLSKTTTANSWSISKSFVEAFNAGYPCAFEVDFGGGLDGATSIPRYFPVYAFGPGSPNSYFLLGTSKYFLRATETNDARVRLESPTQGFMYLSGTGSPNDDIIHWQTSVLP